MKSAVAVLLLAGLLTVFAQSPANQPDNQTETAWSCPVHAVVMEKAAGRCPICRRDLVPVIVTVSWTCADHLEIDRPVQGKCPDGSPMEPRYVQSTHANHNPRHGGLFFMASDLWHHLEGTYAQDELFRVYLYDDYTKPLAPDLFRQVSGRVVMKETFDPATRTTKEIAAVPLRPSADGTYLEARVGRMKLPAEMAAKVKFKAGGEEFRFDFAFPEFSVETSTAPGQPAAVLFEVPDEASEVLKLLDERAKAIGELVQKGAFGEVWVPAFQAKDLALALDVRTQLLPGAGRARATDAIERLVRAAWTLDAAGDTGNRAEVEQAYAAFSRGATDVEQAFSPLVAKGRPR